MTLTYTEYAHSKYYDFNNFVIASTNGYERMIQMQDLDAEIDANPELEAITTVTF